MSGTHRSDVFSAAAAAGPIMPPYVNFACVTLYQPRQREHPMKSDCFPKLLLRVVAPVLLMLLLFTSPTTAQWYKCGSESGDGAAACVNSLRHNSLPSSRTTLRVTCRETMPIAILIRWRNRIGSDSTQGKINLAYQFADHVTGISGLSTRKLPWQLSNNSAAEGSYTVLLPGDGKIEFLKKLTTYNYLAIGPKSGAEEAFNVGARRGNFAPVLPC